MISTLLLLTITGKVKTANLGNGYRCIFYNIHAIQNTFNHIILLHSARLLCAVHDPPKTRLSYSSVSLFNCSVVQPSNQLRTVRGHFAMRSSALYFTFPGSHRTQFSVHTNAAKCLSNTRVVQLLSEQPR